MIRSLLLFSIIGFNSLVCFGQPCTQYVIATANDPVCTGKQLNLSATTLIGASYQWAGPGGYSTTAQNPVRPNVSITYSGSYIVTATVGSCIYKDTVIVQVGFTDNKPTISPITATCVSDTLSLQAFHTIGTHTYQWMSPTGNILSTIAGKGMLPNVAITDTGKYTVRSYGTSGMCWSDTTQVLVTQIYPKPVVSATATNPMCAGDTMRLNALSSIPGLTFEWTIPMMGIVSTPANTYLIPFATPFMSGQYSVKVNNNGCWSAPATMNILVKPVAPPIINQMVDTPGTTTGPWVRITFSALAVNTGTNPSYNWSVNGVIQTAYTGNYFTGIMGIDFADGDEVCFHVKADPTCAAIDKASRCETLKLDLGIPNIQQPVIKIYPNPSDGNITVSYKGIKTAEVYNALGQVILTRNFENAVDELRLNIDAPAGVYLLKLSTGESATYGRFIIER
jgi:hypothetical protein